jgi:hypothetical protein
MREHHDFEPGPPQVARQLRGEPVRQVAGGAANPLADRRRVGPGLQHDLVVIGLEHQRMDAPQQVPDARRRASEIPGDPQPPARGVGHQHRHRLARVVRRPGGVHAERPDGERLPEGRKRNPPTSQRGERAGRAVEAAPQARGQGGRAAGMVAMLVREHDAGEACQIDAHELGAAQQGSGPEARVHQQGGPVGLHGNRVAAAARPEHRELHAGDVPNR